MHTFQRHLDTAVSAGIVLILLTAPTQYSIAVFGDINLSLVDPLVWVVGALWFLRLLWGREIKWVRSAPLVTALFVLMGALSIIRADNRLAAAKDLFQWVEYFGVAFLLFASGLDRCVRLRTACYVFFGIGTAIVGWAVVEYFIPSIPDVDVSASFGNRNVLGGFFSLLLPLMYGWLLWDRHWGRRIWLGTAIVAGVTVTLSGGSLLAIILSCAVLSLLRGQPVFIGYAAAVVLLLGVGLWHLPRENAWTLHESIAFFEPDGTPTQRYPEWQAALVMAEENPFLGVGLGNYQTNVGRYYGTVPNLAKAAEPDSQNLYLVLASSIGLPGLLFFAGTLLYFLMTGFAAAARGGADDAWMRGLAAGSAGALLAFSINCIWSPLLVRGIGIPLVLVMALALCAGQARTQADRG